MKAILLGSSGFWKEIPALPDCPPTLYVPWVTPGGGFDTEGGYDKLGFDVIRFNRIAFGNQEYVVYLQEAPK